MPPNGSMGFDDPAAENTVLLRPQSTIHNPAAVHAPAALAAMTGCVSRRLEAVLSSCQSDSEIDRELWDDLEIHRRSAHTYMNQYLDCLYQVHKQKVRLYEYDNSDHDDGDDLPADITVRALDTHAVDITREEWRLKISRDSLIRDLLAMQETLELLKTRADLLPNQPVLGYSLCMIHGATLGCILWEGSYWKEAIIVFAAHVAGSGCYYLWPKAWQWLRSECIRRYQEEIENLYWRLNQGKVDERNREDLNNRIT